ncbi:ankyrin repeat containing protein YAR1 [Metarhizium album ARSEF 1941]|uniref:Ankyrin repeat containing protein YAR1 n=1 Tax=Metarhizium album (strain ARSEF 1941) TaxID=1081103 RepID=A0A0B2WMQ5_METAS|nr:ankyrin repeat containing protein YAR1 [Metarhizium album ARSEF 1941]KHN94984.1 ankyrin repeat containing protein YAR1 [Metarhizium album ARSEF 1941]
MAPRLSDDEIDDLIYYARAGETDELKESLAALAEREKVSHAEILIAARDEGKSTALHMATGNGHLETVRELIHCFDGRPKEEKQAFIDEANEHGNTGLHWAALGGHLDTVKLLMDHGASPALANERNYVPLDLANFNDKREVAKYFLESAGMLEDDNEESGLANAAASIALDGDEDDKEQEKAT